MKNTTESMNGQNQKKENDHQIIVKQKKAEPESSALDRLQINELTEAFF